MKKEFLITLLATLTVVLFAGCSQQKKTASSENKNTVSVSKADHFEHLKKCMQGNFSSNAQSLSDSDFFDIRLRMIPIWQSTDKEFYLYVEQAMSTALEKPYRQRVYKVVAEDSDHFISYIYTLPSPERFTGKTKDDPIFQSFKPDSLILKDGCEVRLKWDASKSEFSGATGDNTCPSDRSGASWATSKVSINDQRMVSWDQGWNKDGKQVWGAVKGGYIFIKEN